MADARLTGGIKSDGQPPNSLFNGCFLVRRDGVAFYTILVLLVLELGNNFTVRATTHVLKPLPATVIVTVRGGFRNRTSTQLSFDCELILRTLVRSDAPLLKVVYRDCEPP